MPDNIETSLRLALKIPHELSMAATRNLDEITRTSSSPRSKFERWIESRIKDKNELIIKIVRKRCKPIKDGKLLIKKQGTLMNYKLCQPGFYFICLLLSIFISNLNGDYLCFVVHFVIVLVSVPPFSFVYCIDTYIEKLYRFAIWQNPTNSVICLIFLYLWEGWSEPARLSI